MKSQPSCLCAECGKCKKRAYMARWRAENKERVSETRKAWYVRNADKARAQTQAYRDANRDRVRAANRARLRTPADPLKKKARTTVSNGVRLGTLLKKPCEVCASPAEAHHDDYSKPLEVRWLCHTHHMQLHWRVAE